LTKAHFQPSTDDFGPNVVSRTANWDFVCWVE